MSNFNKANQIAEYHAFDANQQDESEQFAERMPVEVLHNESEEVIEPTPPEQAVEPAPLPEISGIINPSTFDCECEQKSEYEPKFYAERSRAVGLVEELDATRKKLRESKKPYHRNKQTLQRVNESIARLKDKMRRYASEHHIKVDLDSSGGEDEEYGFPNVL